MCTKLILNGTRYKQLEDIKAFSSVRSQTTEIALITAKQNRILCKVNINPFSNTEH